MKSLLLGIAARFIIKNLDRVFGTDEDDLIQSEIIRHHLKDFDRRRKAGLLKPLDED